MRGGFRRAAAAAGGRGEHRQDRRGERTNERLGDHERETPEVTARGAGGGGRRQAGHEGEGGAGGQAGNRGLEDVAGQGVGVFGWRQPAAAAEHRRAGERRPQHVQRLLGIEAGGEAPGLDGPPDACRHPLQHLLQQRESLPLLADRRDAAVDEHQVEELPVVLRELVEGPPAAAQVVDRVGSAGHGFDGLIEALESFLGEREEDVVLTGEVAVDRRRAVLDALGDLADRDLSVTLGDEEVPRCGENGVADREPLSVLSFLDAHRFRISEHRSMT